MNANGQPAEGATCARKQCGVASSVREEGIDAGFAVAVSPHQLSTQSVEAIEPLAAVGRDASFEVADGIGQREELSVVEVIQPTEVMRGAHCVELIGEGVVAEIFGGPGRAGRASGQVLTEHAADLFVEIGVGAGITASVFALHEVKARLGNPAGVRHDVILVLQLLAQRA